MTITLNGTKEEIRKTLKAINTTLDVLSTSAFEPNRINGSTVDDTGKVRIELYKGLVKPAK
jgi:hypothetical protein